MTTTETTTTQIPTQAELIARAEALIPAIRAQALEAEQLGHFTDELLQQFRDAGFYKQFLPKMFGGYEVSHETFLEVAYRVGIGDPGTAWCYTLSASHVAIIASMLEEDAQRELVAPHGEIRSPHRAPPGGKAVKTDDGYLISGKWRFSSGVPVSTHFMANTIWTPEDGGDPVEFSFITPVENVEILDDWGGGRGIGVQASGSNTVVIDEPVFVPERHVIYQDLLFGEDRDWVNGTPGTRLHGNGHYLGVYGGFYRLCFAAIFSGAAQAAVDELREMGKRTQALFSPPGALMQDNADVQRTLGEAAAKADAAHAIMTMGAKQSDALLDRWAETGQPITKAETIRLWTLARQSARLACQAVQLAYQIAGPSAVSISSPLQRYVRDCEVYLGHASTQPILDLARGQVEFGLETAFRVPTKPKPKA